ncbi:FAD-binding domain-containing protein [Salinibius halmophilus]|uniref:FAD-binding domain-containing protein n=1 Tax=Salinibius halmophilus TaxID=1853216 RepID=UPI000E663A51|nr:FAD-binding domain-containing protein [Salinibius halmophilus]
MAEAHGVGRKLNVIWFKRDFRVNDHKALQQACMDANKRGIAVVALYAIEEAYWQLPDTSTRQWGFIVESLKALHAELANLNIALHIGCGKADDLLSIIHQQTKITALYSHEETGNEWTFQRDIDVSKWCKRHGITWHEYRQFGVKRRLSNRDDWLKHYQAIIDTPIATPASAQKTLRDLQLPTSKINIARGYDHTPAPQRQHGGRGAGDALLNKFISQNLPSYLKTIGSPAKAAEFSSRLSPYLAYGCISMKEVIRRLEAVDQHKRQRNAFRSRLYWHCHFIQKLEDEPSLARQAMHPQLDDALKRRFDDAVFQKWATGNTGVPWVDACMRSLIAMGWLNFRMRAMLTSFATYHLWLPWQPVGEHLARLFVDYEPGIHWSQIQMQSGVTGINPNRMYNPVQQGQKYDPAAHFIKRWIPELAHLPAVICHQPWLGGHYITPVIDPVIGARQARAKLKAAEVDRSISRRVYQKHGSRRRQPKRKSSNTKQPDLFSE